MEQIKQAAFEDELQKLAGKSDPGGKLFEFFRNASKQKLKPGSTPWQYEVEKLNRKGDVQRIAGVKVPKQPLNK